MNVQPIGAALLPSANSSTGVIARDPKVSGEAAARLADPSQPPLRAQQQPDREKVEAATMSVREFVEPINSNIEFSINDDTGQLVVKIIDRATREVIRQMPSEEMLSIAKALDSLKGLFVKQSA